MQNLIVILLTTKKTTSLPFVVCKLLGWVPAVQAFPTQLLFGDRILLLIQLLGAEVSTTSQHVKAFLSTLSVSALCRNNGQWPVNFPPPFILSFGIVLTLWLRTFGGAVGLGHLGS